MIGIVGLTGGIASGKTTVATLFQNLGVPILDADVISRELVVPQMPAWKKIVEYFGKEVLNPDQTLNRNALKKIVFANENLRKNLEQLLHPLIYETMLERAKELKKEYCLFVVPLLIETNQTHIVQRLLVIDCDEVEQKQRLKERDQLSEIEIEQILAAQCHRQTRLAQADDLIHNNVRTKKDGLMPQVAALHQFYLTLFRTQP